MSTGVTWGPGLVGSMLVWDLDLLLEDEARQGSAALVRLERLELDDDLCVLARAARLLLMRVPGVKGEG